jgi:arylsulfatase A-like enzyme
MMKKTLATMAAALPLTALAASSERPNILFFEVDDLMYRFMGEMGRGFVSTPNIDNLAKHGVYFANAVCQGAMCGPSRNSLITGLYPHNIGFYRNGQMRDLQRGIWSLPVALKRSGYATAWVGKCHVHPPKSDRKQSTPDALRKNMGFDYAVASLGRAMLAKRAVSGKNMDGDCYFEHLKQVGLLETYINDCKKHAKVTSLPEKDYLDGFYTGTAVRWLNNYQQPKPFFLWLNLSCPHGPHDVPQKYHDMYKDKDIPAPLTSKFGSEIPAGLLKDNRAASPKKIPESRRGFAAATTFVDTMLGNVIDELKRKGEYDNTIIVFFSDHGIFMGNHGRFHKGTVFNEIDNPSLIIHYPAKFKQGEIDKHPVELLSILKTMMDVANCSPVDKQVPFGESLIPLLTGKGSYKTRYAFTEIEGFQSCFDGRYRYISGGETPLLYDLQNDPGEMKNIAADHPEVAERMKQATDQWLQKSGPVLSAGYLRSKANLAKWRYPSAK